MILENKGMLTQTLRPKNFNELLGNENNKKILRAILNNPDNSPRVLIFGGKYGSGKCVVPGTRVLTNKGYIKIENLRKYAGDVDDEGFAEFKEDIVTYGGNASHFYYGGFHKTKKVNLENRMEIEGTYKHRIMGISGEEFDWISLGNLKVGDIILAPYDNDVIMPENSTDEYFKGLGFENLSESDRGWFLGYCLSYGGRTGQYSDKELILNSSYDKEVLKEFLISNNITGWKDVSYFLSFPYINGNEYPKIFYSFGRSRKDKYVPEFVFRSNIEFIKGVLAGIVDGKSRNGKREVFSCSSETLVKGVKDIFNLFGIHPKVSERILKTGTKNYRFFVHSVGSIKLKNVISGYCKINHNLDNVEEHMNSLRDRRNNEYKREIYKTGKLRDMINKYGVEYGLGSIGIGAAIKESKALALFYNSRCKWVTKLSLYRYFEYIGKIDEVREYLEYICRFEYVEVSSIGDGYSEVYDITVPSTHKFLANGIINHNTTSARIMARELNHLSENEELSNSPYYYELDASIVGNKESIKEYSSVFSSTIKNGYKVVVLDEIHAASKAAQTLLLKILEEAPKGIFYILCTTDTDKVIDTIKSRALELNFPIQPFEKIAEYVKLRALEIGYTIGDNVANMIAYNSGGHMRNAIMELHKYTLLGNEDYLSSSNNTIEIFCKMFKSAFDGEQYYNHINSLGAFPIIQIKKDFSSFINNLLKSSVLDNIDVIDFRIVELSKHIGEENVKKLVSLYMSDWTQNIYNNEIDLYTGLLVFCSSIAKKKIKSDNSSILGQRQVRVNSGIKI